MQIQNRRMGLAAQPLEQHKTEVGGGLAAYGRRATACQWAVLSLSLFLSLSTSTSLSLLSFSCSLSLSVSCSGQAVSRAQRAPYLTITLAPP